MNVKDWVLFTTGFTIGSIVEVSATLEHDNDCLSQAAAVSQSGFLAYYYYDIWTKPDIEQESATSATSATSPTDQMNFVYSSIYTGKLIDALNKGGCYKFDISLQEIQEYLEP